MRIRLFSDVHLELCKDTARLTRRLLADRPAPLPGDVAVLAGDIGAPDSAAYRVFVAEASRLYRKVFVVAGNHEYYQRDARYSMDEVDARMRSIARSLPNVHFLQRDSHVHDRVRFLGCTLWSRSDPALAGSMNDYRMIPGMTPSESNAMHTRDAAWLCEQLDAPPSLDYDRTVVVTHHLPSYDLVAERYRGHHLNCFFASHLDCLLDVADVWCCGHSHRSVTATLRSCRCYLNPVGYEGEDSGHDPDLAISL